MTRTLHLKHAFERIKPPADMNIVLTEVEDQVCTLLDECTRYLRAEKGIETSCRVAGGWVRDKLLGSQSNDIDIALTDMMGVTFAEHFVSFVSTQKHLPVKAVAKIERNPDQSKHLETARTTILDTELDFVNLRSEEYAENSRIPTDVRFGTPLQDALRRDITINALFYNVHTRSVEDHTQKGIEDLRDGVIRTPLSSKETFQDDPLRVIRCIRFASRFGFDMVPELQEAARDSIIQEALALKISRERVGEEIDKMMKGRDPLRSIQLINDLSLYSSIFTIPPSIITTSSSPPLSPAISEVAALILYTLFQSGRPGYPSNLPPLHPRLLSSSADDSARLYLAAALTPFRGIVYIDAKQKSRLVVEAGVREGLKLGTKNHYLDGIPALFTAAEIIRNPKLERLQSPLERVALGLLLRNKSVHNANTGSHWTTSILFSLVQELVLTCNDQSAELDVDKASTIIETYNTLISRIEELELQSVVEAKSILDGREVVRILGAGKPGVWTGHVLARVVEWQLEHPHRTKEECATWLEGEYREGRISLDGSVVSSVPANRRAKDSDGNTSKKAKR